MPELPEVETVCRGLNQWTRGREIRGGEVLWERTLAHPSSASEFWDGIRGLAIAGWQRRGKYLLAQLDNGTGRPAGGLAVHLRMTGQLLWVKRDEPLAPHSRIRLFLGDEGELRFVDIRTFGRFWWLPPGRSPETIVSGLSQLGPEPLSAQFSLDYLAEKLKTSRRPIKTALLDQALVAGIGNIYADEALFKSGIPPAAAASQLNRESLARLRLAIVEVLQAAIEQGGTTFRDFRSVTGINGNYGGTAWVYGRTGEPCRRCGTAIERLKLAGRSAHFCPQCQHPDCR